MKSNGRDDIPPHLREMAKVTEERDDEARNQHKAVLGVVFVDERGTPHAFQYSHLYRCYVEGDELVAEFTGHRVRMRGRKLFSPVRDCLMRLLTHHKRDLVEALVGGESRDFGQDTGKPVVTSLRVEPIEPPERG